jgi:hypothetical protein
MTRFIEFYLIGLTFSQICRNGGAIYHSMCNEVQQIQSKCFWMGLSTSPEAITVLLQDNLAFGKYKSKSLL